MPADRNLLFGILAVQMDFIQRDALIQAMNAWILDKAKPLGQLLVEQGNLTASRKELLNALVEEHLAQHGHDAQQSLVAARRAATIPPEVDRLLGLKPPANGTTAATDPPLPTDPYATAESSLGTSTSAGTRFRVVRPHAKGGLGEVFVAIDEELHREVALKEIQQRFVNHTESRERFVREAEITGGLEHPGVVPIYGLGQHPDGRPFYAMRYIRGHSLQAAIDRFHQAEGPGRKEGERTLELRQLLGRFVAMCNTMAYAHSRGVIHRDLKPANVMLGNFGETLVVDWGLAKLINWQEELPISAEPPLRISGGSDSDLTQMGAAMGTPAFMSPEQAAGRLDLLGVASDVYGLGATLYYLLTGQAPFSNTDLGLLLGDVQLGNFAAPCRKNLLVPAALEAICLKAMALKPADRYASAQALADDIEHWLADEPMIAYTEPWRARLGRWVRQHKGLVGSAAAIGVMAVTVTVAWRLVDAAKVREAQEQYLRGLAEEKQGETEALRQEANKQRILAEAQRIEANQQRALVQRSLYVSRINLADLAWHENKLASMEALLKEQMPEHTNHEDLRGFEWHYLWRLRHGWLLNCQGHTGIVTCVAFSPDGRRLASGSSDKMVKVWDATTGQEEFSLRGHTALVFSVAFSPDGRRLVSASGKEVKVWEATTGKELGGFILGGHTGPVTSVAISPDGRRLATGSVDETVKVWEATGQEVFSLKGHTLPVTSVAFSPNSGRLASASEDKTVKIWDAKTGQQVISLDDNAGKVMNVAFSPDGLRLAGASHDGTVRVWEATTGQFARNFEREGPLLSLAFSPDASHFAGASQDGTVKIWDMEKNQNAPALMGHTGPVINVAFSPNGNRLASASQDGTVKVWEPTTGPEALSLQGQTEAITSVAFSPDSRRLATTSADTTIESVGRNEGQASPHPKGKRRLAPERGIRPGRPPTDLRRWIGGEGLGCGDGPGSLFPPWSP